jgi:hypothetical protein
MHAPVANHKLATKCETDKKSAKPQLDVPNENLPKSTHSALL